MSNRSDGITERKKKIKTHKWGWWSLRVCSHFKYLHQFYKKLGDQLSSEIRRWQQLASHWKLLCSSRTFLGGKSEIIVETFTQELSANWYEMDCNNTKTFVSLTAMYIRRYEKTVSCWISFNSHMRWFVLNLLFHDARIRRERSRVFSSVSAGCRGGGI